MFHLIRVVKCLIESWLMNNGDEVTVKSLVIVLTPKFCGNGGSSKKCYGGENFQKVQ